MKFSVFIFCLIAITTQAQDNKWSVGIAGLYTTETNIYYNPNAADAVVRNNSTTLNDIFSPSLQVTYQIAHDLDLLFEAEWQKTTYTTLVNALMDNEVNRLQIVDGYEIFPVEINLIYRLPFKPGNFSFFIGGGAGYYFGKHIRRSGQDLIKTDNRSLNYGIQTVIGTEYRVSSYLSTTLGMKFRDPQIKMHDTFTQESFQINGKTVSFGQQHSFYTKVNLDGIVFFLGIKSYF